MKDKEHINSDGREVGRVPGFSRSPLVHESRKECVKMTTRKQFLIMTAANVLTIALVVGFLWVTGNARAEPLATPSLQGGGAPTILNYQGLLTDPATGQPKPDGNYGMTFAVYDASPCSGSPGWSESQTVQVSGGVFNVLLGSVNPLSASVFSSPDRWFGVTVDGTPLPCQRIASVAYAIQAQEAVNADTVNGRQAAELLSRANHTGTQSPSSISPQGAGSGLDADTVDGRQAAELLSRANHTGTQSPSSISPQGAGSGLDADTVDGLQASEIASLGGVPLGTIILWSGSSCPSGWSRFTALDGRFPRGAATYGATGGSSTHSHTYSGTTSRAHFTDEAYARSAQCCTYPQFHDHDYSGTTSSSDHLPPYLDIIFCQKN